MKGQLLIAITCCAITNSTMAQEGFGICNFGKQTVPSVICYGPAVLKNTVVTNNIKVVGPLTARDVLARTMSVTGSADLANTEVSGDVNITGNLQTQNVHFYKGLTIQADSAVLSNTVVTGDIYMNSSATKPTIRLQCKTSVAGSIIFGGIAGVVEVSDDSSLQGKIRNGDTVFIRVKCS